MAKKVIINESTFRKLLFEQVIEESGLNKTDIANAVKDAINNDSGVKKDIEKQVKKLVAASVNLLFKTLWQRRNFYESELEK